jgi:hypothetical protein
MTDVGGFLPEISSVEQLVDGRLHTVYKNGVEVFARAQSQVTFEEETQTDTEGSLAVVLQPPALDEAGMVRAMSVPEEGKLRAMSADDDIGSEIEHSNCIKIGGSVAWHGCYRYWIAPQRDPDAYYVAVFSVGGGHGKGVWRLRTGRIEHRFGPGVKVIDYRPTEDIPGKNEQVTIGIEAYGLKLSETFTAHPEKISIKWAERNFAAQWNGKVADENVGVKCFSLARVPNGQDPKFQFRIYEYHRLSGPWDG